MRYPDERQIPSTCLLKFSELSMVTPRLFTLSETLISAPAILTEAVECFVSQASAGADDDCLNRV